MNATLRTDDRTASIHWAQSKIASRSSLFFIFKDGVRIAECWNTANADLLVTGLRGLDQLSDCQRPEGD
jgi:hypothetical protein